MKEEKKIIEAALFISARPMTLEELRTLTGIGALGYLQSVVEELKKDYSERAIEVVETEGRYEMRVKSQFLGPVKQFAQDSEISKSALRTLAYLSKHDGMLKSELVKRVGTHVYTDVKELVQAGFIKSHRAGRTSKLNLTDKFRKYFVESANTMTIGPKKQQTSLAAAIEAPAETQNPSAETPNSKPETQDQSTSSPAEGNIPIPDSSGEAPSEEDLENQGEHEQFEE